jgi:hypothetical protein
MEEASALLEARAGAPKAARRGRTAKKAAPPKRASKKPKRAVAGA